VSGSVQGPALRGAANLDLSTPERLVSRSLANREGECVRNGPHQFPAPITVVVLVCLFGGGHGVSPLV
jgi:hypothetical protein